MASLNGLESEQTLGAGDGQGSLACCSPWSCIGLNITEQLNWWKLMKAWGVNENSSKMCLLSLFIHAQYKPMNHFFFILMICCHLTNRNCHFLQNKEHIFFFPEKMRFRKNDKPFGVNFSICIIN